MDRHTSAFEIFWKSEFKFVRWSSLDLKKEKKFWIFKMRFLDYFFDCLIDFFDVLMFILKESDIDIISFSFFLLHINQPQIFLDPDIELLCQRVSFVFD